MTDEQVIRALGRCGMHRECCYCNSVEECGDKEVLVATALDLIKRQQAQLRKEQNKNSKVRNERNRLKAEVEHLRDLTKKIKAEVYKEFAERLKEERWDAPFETEGTHYVQVVDAGSIDDLVKELTEVSNEN